MQGCERIEGVMKTTGKYSVLYSAYLVCLFCFISLFIMAPYYCEASELHKASAFGDVKLVKELLSKGLNVNELAPNPKARDKWPKGSPLHWAAACGHIDVVRLLLSHGADVNIFTDSGDSKIVQTPLDYAVGEGHKDVVKFLLESGANVESANQEFHWPLEMAVRMERLDIADLLLKHGADINRMDFEGYTALHRVILEGKAKSVEYLVNKEKIDVNACDPSNCEAPLHLAAYVGDGNIVKLLIKHGAKIDAKDSEGKTALMIAEEEGNKEIVQLLKWGKKGVTH
jgi:ankyrin repeat protein